MTNMVEIGGLNLSSTQFQPTCVANRVHKGKSIHTVLAVPFPRDNFTACAVVERDQGQYWCDRCNSNNGTQG